MNGHNRKQIKPGQIVDIVLKQNQCDGKVTRGMIKEILTNSVHHPRGIKVRLHGRQVGRVQQGHRAVIIYSLLNTLIRFPRSPTLHRLISNHNLHVLQKNEHSKKYNNQCRLSPPDALSFLFGPIMCGVRNLAAFYR